MTRLRAARGGRSEGISAQIFRGASSTALLKVISTGLTFVTAILLARFLGVEEYGIFAYAMSWVTLLGVFAGLGLGQVIVAEVAVYHQNNDWARIRGIFRFAIAAAVAAGIVCALAIAAIGWLMHRDEQGLYTALLLASFLLPLRALLLPLGATQNGLRQVTFAQSPSMLVSPAMFLAFFVSAFGLEVLAPSAASALVLQGIAFVAAFTVAVLFLRKGFTAAGRPKTLPQPRYEPKAWLFAGLPMILMGSMFLVNSNADILMLGALAGPEAAGIYKAAARGAELLNFGVAVVSVPLGPVVARLYAAGEMDGLQRELRRWACVAFLPTLALALVFLYGGELFLGLFGENFVDDQARSALSILTLGQLVLAASGAVGLLLVMTGHRNVIAGIMAFIAALNVGLNAVLIPMFGVRGAAYATAFSTALLAFLLVQYTMRKMKLNPTVISCLPSSRR